MTSESLRPREDVPAFTALSTQTPQIKDWISQAKESFDQRPFRVLFGHFPPFIWEPATTRGVPTGPLVNLVRRLASCVGQTVVFERLKGWQAVYERMRNMDVVTVAVPIYRETRVRFHLCCFCEIETFYFLTHHSRFTHDLRNKLAVLRTASSNLRDAAGPILHGGGAASREVYAACDAALHIAMADVHEHIGIVAPSGFVEHRQFDKVFGFEPISIDPDYKAIRRSARKNLVLLNKATLEDILSLPKARAEYRWGHLLDKPFVFQAGLPFHAGDAPLAHLCNAMLKSGDAELESELAKCCVHESAKLLPLTDRTIRKPVEPDALQWLAPSGDRISGGLDLAGGTTVFVASALVVELNWLGDETWAAVRVFESGEDSRHTTRRFSRQELETNNVWFEGARFQYRIVELGRLRIASIIADAPNPPRELISREPDAWSKVDA